MMKRWGTLVLVVGPSGAGKDSIIRGAQNAFSHDSHFVFPRRIVTRKADIAAEDHDSVSDMEFASSVEKGDFAIWWKAHGNGYGLPVSIDDDLRIGRTVIFNCSRTVVGEVQKTYPKVTVADIQVSAAQLVERIVARGRETHEQAIQRVNREVPPFPPGTRSTPICNDGSLDLAVSAFCNLLQMLKDSSADTEGPLLDNQVQNGDRHGYETNRLHRTGASQR